MVAAGAVGAAVTAAGVVVAGPAEPGGVVAGGGRTCSSAAGWSVERRLTAGTAAASFVAAAEAEQDARVRSEATITILAFNMVFWMFSEVALIGDW